MNPITPPTSPETRAALEAIDWKFGRTTDAGVEVWCNHPDDADGTWFELLIYPSERDPLIVDGCSDGDEPVPLRLTVATAGAIGFHPPGYRIIPEETAQRAAGYARMKGANFYDVPSVRDQAYQDAETLWPSAAPHQTPIQDQAPALQAEGRPVSFPDAPLPKPRPSEKGGPSPSQLYQLSLLKIPTHCPITELPFFCMARLDDRPVPTYGGPFDVYTIPEPDEESDSGYKWRHYDQDAGGWVDGWEHVPKSLINQAGAPTTKEE